MADSTSTVEVPIPDGVAPRRIVGVLAVEEVQGGQIELLVNGEQRRSVTAMRERKVTVPVGRADVDDDGVISLGVRYAVPAGSDQCRVVDPSGASLSDLELLYGGTETAPTSLADFFPDAASRIDVSVRPESSDAELEAALTATGSLAARYGGDTPVQMSQSNDRLPRTGAGQRVVRLLEDPTFSTEVEDRFGLWTLTVKGPAEDLVSAARTLGTDELQLAGGEVTELASVPQPRDAETTQTLADLGRDTVSLRGWGRSTAYVGVKQDAFGGPVEKLEVHLVGEHTAVPQGARAQLDVHFNGFLLGSKDLTADDGTDIDMTLEVPASQLKSDNGLEVSLSGVPDDGCLRDNTQLPLEVDLDGERSTLEATRGTGDVDGFELFPQVLAGQLPIAIRGAGESARTESAIDASYLVASLQRAASAPLEIEMVDPDEFLASERSGLFVGADYADSVAFEAPLRLDGMRLLDYAEAEFQVGSEQPFAALETLRQNGRHVVMLGAWSPDDGSLPTTLTRAAVTEAAELGWSTLTDDLLVASEGVEPFTLSTNAVVPQEERVEEERSYAWWFVGGVAVLLVLLAVQLMATVRKDRRVRALVDAQEEHDRGLEDEPGTASTGSSTDQH